MDLLAVREVGILLVLALLYSAVLLTLYASKTTRHGGRRMYHVRLSCRELCVDVRVAGMNGRWMASADTRTAQVWGWRGPRVRRLCELSTRSTA